MLAQAVEGATTTVQTSTAETVAFWVLAPVTVLASLGMLLVRKAVHSALLLAVTMISLAVLYLGQSAPFLGVVQVVVYTGAVMMLFLFVLMLVGVDSSDSLVETIRGQRVAAVVAGVGFGALLLLGLGRAVVDPAGDIAAANAGGNVEGIAALLFGRYVLAFEVTAALLITAAIAAMVLTHRERIGPRQTQRELSKARFAPGGHPTPLPAPGVYARHNAVDTPALLPDGSPAEVSVNRTLTARGETRTPSPDDGRAIERQLGLEPGHQGPVRRARGDGEEER
ncbi:NADH-quinone oxidoreductase subunit J [Vallicoccus soli]|uniref:NADH-quinone oxidoreductase subunit J n=1 Tax=Vallicoccus soli TaxID=2339232 RepID=A0A3A3YS45_9ACTN|nr:NADH-quinone oxidoreductase subunit J [Vallicoccus soli]